MARTVNPTRMELTRLKRRVKTAVRGHKLLKDKRDEMVRRFIELVRRQRDLREECEAELARAMSRFSAVRARIGDEATLEALIYPVRSAEITTGRRNIMSVDVPTIALKADDGPMTLPYSFAFTSAELDESVLELGALMPKLIELAEIEKTCNMLADEIEKTRRRVNALEHVMIPEMENQIKFITMKLDENERGTINRLMKVKDIIANEQQAN